MRRLLQTLCATKYSLTKAITVVTTILTALPSQVIAAPSAHPAHNITQKQLTLGLSLLKQGRSEHNHALSPYSIHAGLTLARIGAIGLTGSELDKLLFPSPFSQKTIEDYKALNSEVTRSDETISATLANSVWISDQGSFTQKFLNDTSEGFQAEARSIDFRQTEAARQTINSWVSEKTNALIPHLLPPGIPRPDTRATLVNALYFKAAWDNPFAKGQTKSGDFWLPDGTKTTVPMMHLETSLPYFENSAWQAVQLSYAQGSYAYLLMVPRTRLTTSSIASTLTQRVIQSALETTTRSTIKLSMPRHKIRQTRELVDSIKALGITQPFSEKADYSAMTTLPATITSIIHEAVINIDEAGTEAAAATAVIMAKTAMFFGDSPKELKSDHPFAYAIVHKATQAPLFVGIVGNPLE